jgi:metallo-beta-lactamase class B
MSARIAITVAVVALFSVGSALDAQLRPYEPAWNRPAIPHKVIGNVYFVGTTELGTFLIATRNGHILLDPGFEESVPLIKSSMRTLGFKYEDVRVLLNSQAHYDHAAGLALIKKETGARLEAMGPDADLLAAGGRTDFLFGTDGLFRPVVADRILKDGDVVEQGGVKLVARHTPGHTKGATTFITTVEEAGRAHQVVFAVSTTVNPGTSLIDNPKYPNIIEDWQRTYAILDSLVGDVWIAAHASMFDMTGKLSRIGKSKTNPYVDPQGYRRYVANGRQRFSTLLAEQIPRAR